MMDCMFGRGICRMRRELLYWRRMALCATLMAVFNFAIAWTVAFCRVAGEAR